MGEYLVDIRQECFSFFDLKKEIKALRGVSLRMREGEVLGIVGESGCGKSVTAYSLMGLTPDNGRVTGGEVYFNGHRIDRMDEKELRRIRGREISMIFQDPMTALNPVYSIGNQIREAIRIGTGERGAAADKRAAQLLELVGIAEAEKRLKQYPHELSGGMRQRVMIAMALACNPRLLIADEPTTALDVTVQAQILELMKSLKKKLGMAIMLITHDLGVVATMCDNVAVMYAGEVVEYGSVDDIFFTPMHEYTKGLLQSVPGFHEKGKKLTPIEGQPADITALGQGCAFAARCPSCLRICLKKDPPERLYDGEHYTRCWLREKERLKEEGRI